MEIIVLAGGRGTRLQSMVSDVPKPMAPINNRPFLEILFKQLVNANASHIILSVGYMHQNIINHFGSSYKNIPITIRLKARHLGLEELLSPL